MTTIPKAHAVHPGEGATADLGIIRMRVLAAGDTTAEAFTLTEFEGGAGPWTVPHVHRSMEESFYVLDGELTFTVGDDVIVGRAGSYVLVPRGTPHVLSAGPAGARCLGLMVPGGLERMFFELAELPGEALRDPEARAAVAARHDSIPVTAPRA